ncbi:MAG: hypothetical protein EB101_03550 [Chitinophagia bacterium]|nr:hypothetical protein [Chitinophagia bacterium]
MSNQFPSPSDKEQAFDSFREELDDLVETAIDQHEAKMTKLGFVFLAIFVSVIAIAAFLP